jgi:chromosome segregation ATPase
MIRPRSRRPRSPSKTDVVRPAKTAAELEGDLAELRFAMELQKREFEENEASCSQALARVAHSERTLSQTKAKLIAADEAATETAAQMVALRARLQESDEKLQRLADERTAQSERERALTEVRDRASAELEEQSGELARLRDALTAALEREPAFRQVEAELRSELDASRERAEQAVAQHQELRALAESLSRDSAAGASECARLAESHKLVEERETQALIAAESARDDLKVALSQLEEARSQSEEARSQSEQTRLQLEEARLQSEQTRLQLEEARSQSEQTRLQLEEARSQSEQTRLQLEEARSQSEQTRLQLEEARSQLEELRLGWSALEELKADCAAANEDREHLLCALGAVEALAQRIARVSTQAKSARGRSVPSAESHEASPTEEEERATVKPTAPSKDPPRSARRSTAPEIMVDGVLLVP